MIFILVKGKHLLIKKHYKVSMKVLSHPSFPNQLFYLIKSLQSLYNHWTFLLLYGCYTVLLTIIGNPSFLFSMIHKIFYEIKAIGQSQVSIIVSKNVLLWQFNIKHVFKIILIFKFFNFIFLKLQNLTDKKEIKTDICQNRRNTAKSQKYSNLFRIPKFFRPYIKCVSYKHTCY